MALRVKPGNLRPSRPLRLSRKPVRPSLPKNTRYERTRSPRRRKESRMAKARIGSGLLAGCLMLGGAATAWAAPPTVSQMLGSNFRPHQEGISYTTPTAQEEAACKVEPVKRGGQNVGWQLVDGRGRLLRRFYAGSDENRI